MVGIVLVTHPNMAEGMQKAAEMIVGPLEHFKAISVDPNEENELVWSKISDAIKEVDDNDGILILTDMFGGTPSNVSLSFLKENEIDIITGVNLPMLIKLSTYRKEKSKKDLSTLSQFIAQYGKDHIHLASSSLLKKDER